MVHRRLLTQQYETYQSAGGGGWVFLNIIIIIMIALKLRGDGIEP